MPILDPPSELEMLVALGLIGLGVTAMLFGLLLAAGSPRARANPGDALAALGLALAYGGMHLLDAAAWAAIAGALIAGLRLLFALVHSVDERNNPTRSRESVMREKARNERQRLRERRIVEETVRRYAEHLRRTAAPQGSPGDPIEIRPHPRPERTRPAPALLPAPEGWGAIEAQVMETVDAEFEEVAIEDEPLPTQEDEEILVRFATPIDADDLFRRPDRPRTVMDAIIAQLGEGARIVGIRARRG